MVVRVGFNRNLRCAALHHRERGGGVAHLRPVVCGAAVACGRNCKFVMNNYRRVLVSEIPRRIAVGASINAGIFGISVVGIVSSTLAANEVSAASEHVIT